jgi:hypothetical protein
LTGFRVLTKKNPHSAHFPQQAGERRKKGEVMKTKLLNYAAAVVVLTLSVVKSGYAQDSPLACDNRLVKGLYGFTLQGTKLAGPAPIGPQVGVAMAYFDGDGSFEQVDTVTINGEESSNFTHPAAKGTYTVSSNCTGTFTIVFTDGRPPVVTNFVVVDDGREIDTVVVSVAGKQGILALGSVGKKVFSKP